MKAMRFVCSLPLGLALTACPGDDGGAVATDGATDPSGSGTSQGPSSDPTTTPSGTSNPSTSDATTSMTTDTTGSDTDVTGDSSSGSTGPTLECPYRPVDGQPGVTLEVVAEGFSGPLLVVGDPVDHDVLYVLQKGGQIKRLGPGETMAPEDNWLELSVDTNSEAGLLGLAFHPDYADNGLIYVSHTPQGNGNEIVVTEFTVADGVPGSPRNVIGIGHEAANHNGGMIQFGPDDMLYISVGDGGPQNDGCGHGQNTQAFMGKILRIDPVADGTPDVDPGCVGNCGCGPAPGQFDYTVPKDNPFVGMNGFRPEIYAYGFRNPWRMSFDPIDGRLWVTDVGQGSWEEVSVIERGDNAGWGGMEGAHCFNDNDCDDAGLTGQLNADGIRLPVAEFANAGARCAGIGLGNYRSCEVPAWDGVYFYGDQCSGDVFAVAFDGTTVTDLGQVTGTENQIWGGGYNAYGDVFVASSPQFGGPGTVYRIAPGK